MKKEVLLEFNKPTINNRIYKLENFVSIPVSVPLAFNSNEPSPLGLVENIRVEDGKLVGDVTVTENYLKAIIDGGANFKYTTSGTGELNSKNEVINFNLTHVCPSLNQK